ncbi:MAG: hypothetical protein ACI9UA_004064 [Pseudoalteromonas tetraodonis]|jgi:hypothetical protein
MAHGFPPDADLQSDPNSDGVNLMMAFAMDGDPNQDLRHLLPVASIDADAIRLTYYSGNPEIKYLIQTSTDLRTWGAGGVTVTAPDAGNRRTAIIVRAGAARYARLVVEFD